MLCEGGSAERMTLVVDDQWGRDESERVKGEARPAHEASSRLLIPLALIHSL